MLLFDVLIWFNFKMVVEIVDESGRGIRSDWLEILMKESSSPSVETRELENSSHYSWSLVIGLMRAYDTIIRVPKALGIEYYWKPG